MDIVTITLWQISIYLAWLWLFCPSISCLDTKRVSPLDNYQLMWLFCPGPKVVTIICFLLYPHYHFVKGELVRSILILIPSVFLNLPPLKESTTESEWKRERESEKDRAGGEERKKDFLRRCMHEAWRPPPSLTKLRYGATHVRYCNPISRICSWDVGTWHTTFKNNYEMSLYVCLRWQYSTSSIGYWQEMPIDCEFVHFWELYGSHISQDRRSYFPGKPTSLKS